MPMPDFIKKKIDAKKGADAEEASKEEESESGDAPAAKKSGKLNPLKMWAGKNK